MDEVVYAAIRTGYYRVNVFANRDFKIDLRETYCRRFVITVVVAVCIGLVNRQHNGVGADGIGVAIATSDIPGHRHRYRVPQSDAGNTPLIATRSMTAILKSECWRRCGVGAKLNHDVGCCRWTIVCHRDGVDEVVVAAIRTGYYRVTRL